MKFIPKPPPSDKIADLLSVIRWAWENIQEIRQIINRHDNTLNDHETRITALEP